jgi:hypothetical protein
MGIGGGLSKLHILELDDSVSVAMSYHKSDGEIYYRRLTDIPGSYNWRSIVKSVLSEGDYFCDEEPGGLPIYTIEGTKGPFEEDMFRLIHQGQQEREFARVISDFSDEFLLRLIKEEGDLRTAAQKTFEIDDENEALLNDVLPICPESLLVDLADQEGSILEGWGQLIETL